MLDFGLEFNLTLGVGSSDSKIPKTYTLKLKNKPKMFKNTETIIAEITKIVLKAFVMILLLKNSRALSTFRRVL
jgi:hypothetical protein